MPVSSSSSPTHAVPAQYSVMTGLVYVFNVIVGTGALAVPGVVGSTGWLISPIVLFLLAFMSYITVTFTIEAMAISNAVILTADTNSLLEDEQDGDDGEEQDPLVPSSRPPQQQGEHPINQDQILSRQCFDISRTVEMGHMARLFFPHWGVVLFYVTLTVYLYGDLSIYVTAVAKSLRDLTCGMPPDINSTTVHGLRNCTDILSPMDNLGVYRLYCILFIVVVGPFTFLQISGTKYLQLTTTVLRWTAFITMIVIAFGKILQQDALPPSARPHPPMIEFKKIPSLFGVSIYSFMCHHSLPSLVTPIRNKKSLHLLFALDYLLIATFYILLSVTGVFAFPYVRDLYTLNFVGDGDGNFVNYFLPLFPVFTLSTNFPIIAITLKNNLRTLFEERQNQFSNIFYTLLAIVPPFLLSIFVQNVQFLVNLTGSLPGAGIQYVIPTVVLMCARKKIGGVSGLSLNPYSSPFQKDWWAWAVLIWCAISVGLVLLHFVYA